VGVSHWIMVSPGLVDIAWSLVCEVCRMTAGWVDCRCFLSFVFVGGAMRLGLSPCNREERTGHTYPSNQHKSNQQRMKSTIAGISSVPGIPHRCCSPCCLPCCLPASSLRMRMGAWVCMKAIYVPQTCKAGMTSWPYFITNLN